MTTDNQYVIDSFGYRPAQSDHQLNIVLIASYGLHGNMSYTNSKNLDLMYMCFFS